MTCLIHPIDSVVLVGGVSVGGAMPCAEINSSFCVHGTCEMKNDLPTCRYDPQHMHKSCIVVNLSWV